ncbi:MULTISPECIES: PAS domain S-box protein [Trichocoleus]|uniref:histidine kinase n=1 Tax=Trichocoleus desertorum GB2-A4 TaxID=2933944 RepID=A0ABV0J426_9CYAN|nr:PAS domain S-box protein [Trichocoleus sp. FACHB-46]MBD1861881.1 PAS domain S-box protein [Trichocoleus sp. FACHB-46]
MNYKDGWALKHFRWLRYGVAVLVVVAATVVRLLLNPLLGNAAPFLPFILAVLFSAWYGGLRPGLLSTGLSAGIIHYFWLRSNGTDVVGFRNLILLGLFLTAGIGLSWVNEVLHRSRRGSEATLKALRSSEEQYRLLVDGVKDCAIYLLDAQGYVMSWNAGAERIEGYRAEEIIGQHFSRFCPPEDVAQGKPERVIAAAIAQERFEEEGWRVRKDGSRFWSHLLMTALWDEAGELRGFSKLVRDISDRQRAEAERQQSEAALQRSEEQLRLALDASQAGIWDWNLPTGTVSWSSKTEQLLGLIPGTFSKTYETFLEAVHPGDRDQVVQAVAKALETKKDYAQEFRVTWPDGSIHWIAGAGKLLLNDQGEVVRMLGTNMDVTERKQTELALQQQTERERLIGAIAQRLRQSLNLEEILNTAVAEVRQFLQTDRVIIYEFQADQSGVVVVESIAPEWTSLQGTVVPPLEEPLLQLYRAGQVSSLSDIYATPLEPDCLNLLTQFQIRADLVIPILQGEELWGLLVVHHCASAHEWQALEIDLLKQLAAQLAIAIQQSQLYQQVQQLNSNLEHQVQERMQQLQQALNFEAVLKRITDKVRDSLDEGHILQTAVRELALVLQADSCNAALYDLEQGTADVCYEYTTSTFAFQGRRLHLESFPEIYQPLLQGQCVQFCSIMSSSRQDQAALLACPVLDDQGVLGDLWLRHRPEYIFTEQEIRLVQQIANQGAIALRQARLYQAAQAQVEALERLNQLKDDFLSTVSHELRTPVANMKMSIRMLELALKQEVPTSNQPQKSERYLRILQDECEREISLINDLLDLQRLEVGVQPLTLTTIDLYTWVEQLVKPFEDRMRARQQTLQVEIAPELPPLVSDLLGLERILGELLNNACKYTPPGDRICVKVQAQAERIRFQVINLGAEIPAHELSRIFDKFYRVPSADPWKQGGTGLGLALVQKLTRHLQGQVYVESANHRTVFTVEVPMTLAAELAGKKSNR